MAVGGDVDDADAAAGGGGGSAEDGGEEEACEEVVADVVCAKLDFVALRGFGVGGCHYL